MSTKPKIVPAEPEAAAPDPTETLTHAATILLRFHGGQPGWSEIGRIAARLSPLLVKKKTDRKTVENSAALAIGREFGLV